METFINKIKEKKLPEQVNELLMAETERKNITGIWLYRSEQQQCSLLTVLCEDKLLLQRTFRYLFIGDTFEQDRVLISILDDADLEQHRQDRYVFFSRYASKEDQIYGDEKDYGRFVVSDSDLRPLRERYLKGEQLLMKYTQELIVDEQAGATLFYLKNLQHDLEFLEYLRFGRPFEDFALPERLRQMEAFIPEVKKFFVKEGNHYYLLRQIENEEIVEYMDEYQHHICKVKNQMKQIVLRNMQAKLPRNLPLKPAVSHELLKNKVIRKVLRPLLHMAHLEEMYVFHEITSIQDALNVTHYYLLAVVSKEKLKEAARVTQKINEGSPAHLKFTIIYHTRLWIQENVYQSQYFFKTLMNNDHKIYTTAFHPKIHWDGDDTYYCDDAVIYYRKSKNIYKRHLKGVARDEKSAMVSIIPKELNEYFVQILICRLYDTVGYLPEINDVKVLWDLFIYVNGSETDYDELLGSFSFDLIRYLTANKNEKLPALKINQTEKKKLFRLLIHLRKTRNF